MGFRRKKSFLENASDTVNDSVLPAIESAVDTAREKAAPYLAEGKALAAEKAAEAREAAAPMIAEGREVAARRIAEAREAAAPKIAEGRERAAEAATQGRERAAVKVAAFRDADAGDRVQAFKDAEPKKGGRVKKLVIFGALAAVGGLIFRQLRGRSDDWQSTYQPTPPPAGPTGPVPPTPDSSATDRLDDPLTDPIGDVDAPGPEDAAGSTPGEALSDDVEKAHADTDPDAPAEKVDLDEGDAPRP